MKISPAAIKMSGFAVKNSAILPTPGIFKTNCHMSAEKALTAASSGNLNKSDSADAVKVVSNVLVAFDWFSEISWNISPHPFKFFS